MRRVRVLDPARVWHHRAMRIRPSVRAVGVTFAVLALLTSSPVGAQNGATMSKPERIFEELWGTFDCTYGLFPVKEAHWDDLYRVYRPRVAADTTDEELFEVLAAMLGHLDDNHALLETPKGHPDTYLSTGDLSTTADGTLRNRENDGFSPELIDRTYVQGPLETRLGGTFAFGRLGEAIGYLRLSAFEFVGPTAAAMDEFLEACDGVQGIVIDVRGNGGGSTHSALEIAGRFADRERLVGWRRLRRGTAHDDFTDPIPLRVEPTGGERHFDGPVLVLTDPFSQSAADVFALAMRVLPSATLIGEPTSGSFSTILGLRLENGWLYSVSYELVTDYAGRAWDGIGVPPDLRVASTAFDVAAGRDRVIEFACTLLESDALQRYDDPATYAVDALPSSLAHAFGAWLDEGDASAAVAKLRATRERGGHYLAAEELWKLACDRLAAGRGDDVDAVLDVLFEDLAGEWMFAEPGANWDVLLAAEDPERTRRILEHALELDPRTVLGAGLRARAVDALAGR